MDGVNVSVGGVNVTTNLLKLLSTEFITGRVVGAIYGDLVKVEGVVFPTAFCAINVNVYVIGLVRPVMVIGDDVVLG